MYRLKYYLLVIIFSVNLTNLLAQKESRFNLSNSTIYSPGDNPAIYLRKEETTKSVHFKLLQMNTDEKTIENFYNSINKYFDIWSFNEGQLLTYTKLIKEWDETFLNTEKFSYAEKTVKLGVINSPGIYIVQAISDTQVAYIPVIVAKYAMYSIKMGDEIVTFVCDAKTGKFVLKAEFDIYKNGQKVEHLQCNNEGLLYFNHKGNERRDQSLLISTHVGDEVVFNNPYFYFDNRSESTLGYLFTNQPIYRPGAEVNFKGIFSNLEGNTLSPIKGKKLSVKITSPKYKDVFNAELTTNEFGSIFSGFKLQTEADLGSYSIYVSDGEHYYYAYFEVEEYKKPEYKVEVEFDKNHYTLNDSIRGKIKANYFFGAPVTEGEVAIRIYLKDYYIPWWYGNEYSWFYRYYASDAYYSYDQRQLTTIKGKLNSKGEVEFSYSLPEDQKRLGKDFFFSVNAEVVDNSRRSVSGSSQVRLTRGEFTVTATSDQYYIKVGDDVTISAKVLDFDNKPVQSKVNFVLKRQYSEDGKTNIESLEKYEAATDQAGLAKVSMKISKPGYYNFTALAKDSKGVEISAVSHFYVSSENYGWYSRSGKAIDIITNKQVYKAGDTLKAMIIMPEENMDILLTYERNGIVALEKLTANGSVAEFTKILTGAFSPATKIYVHYVKDFTIHTGEKTIAVLDESKFLKIAIESNKPEFKPGEKPEFKIKFTDYLGKPVSNAELSFGAIDESLYSIKEDETERINEFFYKPVFKYLQSSFSRDYKRIATCSRRLIINDTITAGEKFVLPKNGYGKIAAQFKLVKELYDNESPYSESAKFVLTNGRDYFAISLDSTNSFLTKDIPAGNYDLVFFNKFQALQYIANVKVLDGEVTKLTFSLMLTENFPCYDGRQFDKMTNVKMEKSDGNTERNSDVKSNKKETPKATEVREKFVDAAFWAPAILTDAKGEAIVSFKLPDNLTSWRVTIRGNSQEFVVGEVKSNYLARKDIMVRTETPRFFRQGDTVTITTNIHNYFQTKEKVFVTFNTTGLKLISSAVREGTKECISTGVNNYRAMIAPSGLATIDWVVVANEVIDTASITLEAVSRFESDAMKLKIPVMPYGVRKNTFLNSSIHKDSGEETLTFTLPENIDIMSAKATISLSPSAAKSILLSLDELVNYPYGCVEQTMSRFLPAIIVAQTFKDLKVPLKEHTFEILPDVIAKGQTRLEDFQHPDGGWGWWKADATNPFMSAYVVFGLNAASTAGYDVKASTINGGVEYIHAYLTRKDQNDRTLSDDKTVIAYMLYVLSTLPKPEDKTVKLIDSLAEVLVQTKLDAFSLTLLGLTFKNRENQKAAEEVLTTLISLGKIEDYYAFWASEKESYRWQQDKVQITAYVLKFLAQMNYDINIQEKIVRFLLGSQKGGYWNSTQQTAFSIFGILEYLKKTNELDPSFTVQLSVNGNNSGQYFFDKTTVFSTDFRINLDGKSGVLKKGKNTITLKKSGKGSLYSPVKVEYYSKEISKPYDGYFKINREYSKLIPTQKSGSIEYVPSKFDSLKPGDVVLVTLSIENNQNDMQYLMVEDMLPSGFEVVKDENLYIISGQKESRDYYYWGRDSKEFRDNRISIFHAYPEKKMKIQYMLKAQIEGVFTAMPTEASLMYYPEITGSGVGRVLKVFDK